MNGCGASAARIPRWGGSSENVAQEVRRLENEPLPAPWGDRLTAGVQDKYLKHPGFTATSTTVGGRRALLLVSGTMTTDQVSWAATLTGLTAQPVDLGNETAAAALLIRSGTTDAWALTYGMGFQLLDQNKVDNGFGQRIVIRTADPHDLNSLTRTTLDHRSRTDR